MRRPSPTRTNDASNAPGKEAVERSDAGEPPRRAGLRERRGRMDLGLVAEPEERAMLVIDERAAEVVGVLDGLPREVRARDEQLDASVRCRRASLGLDVPRVAFPTSSRRVSSASTSGRKYSSPLRSDSGSLRRPERSIRVNEPSSIHVSRTSSTDAAAHDRAREQAPVETARTRARDDVRAKEAARQPEELAVDRRPPRPRARSSRARPAAHGRSPRRRRRSRSRG